MDPVIFADFHSLPPYLTFPRLCGVIVAYPLGDGKMMGSILGLNCVIAKNIKNSTAAMSDARH